MKDSLNNLRLGTLLLSALYKHSIFEIEERENLQESIIKEVVPSFRYLGNHLKKVTILVNNPEHTFMPDDQLAFLTRMLTACQMNLGDVAIVNRNVVSSENE